jgi:hypothetical protein
MINGCFLPAIRDVTVKPETPGISAFALAIDSAYARPSQVDIAKDRYVLTSGVSEYPSEHLGPTPGYWTEDQPGKRVPGLTSQLQRQELPAGFKRDAVELVPPPLGRPVTEIAAQLGVSA